MSRAAILALTAVLISCSGSDFRSSPTGDAAGRFNGSGGLSSGAGGARSEPTTGGEAGAQDAGRVCDPGATQECFGAGRCAGAQACDLRGSAWSECVCGAPEQGGAGGTSGSGGDASATGGSGLAAIGGGAGASAGGVNSAGSYCTNQGSACICVSSPQQHDGCASPKPSCCFVNGGSCQCYLDSDPVCALRGMPGYPAISTCPDGMPEMGSGGANIGGATSGGTGGSAGAPNQTTCGATWSVTQTGFVFMPVKDACWSGNSFAGGDAGSSVSLRQQLEISGSIGPAGNVYLGFNVGQAAGSGAIDPITPNGVSLTVGCSGCDAAASIQLVGDDGTRWCATVVNGKAIPYSQFASACDGSGAHYALTPFTSIRILLTGSFDSAPFDLKVFEITEQ